MKLDLEKKISVYMFVIMVLVFVLLFAWICSSQMKFTVNKILESQTRLEVPTKTPTYTPTSTIQSTTNKYPNY